MHNPKVYLGVLNTQNILNHCHFNPGSKNTLPIFIYANITLNGTHNRNLTIL